MMNRKKWCTVLCALAAHSLAAQVPTNAEIYESHAVECLIAVPDTARAFTLHSPGVMSFLETALVTRWNSADVAVYRTDSMLTAPLPGLAYQVEAAQVSYGAAGRKRITRQVSLALRFSWTSRKGQVLRSERCARADEDLVLRRQVASLEHPAYPETTGVLPPAGWPRRYLEPLALGAATVVTVFLFFNLRGSRTSTGG